MGITRERQNEIASNYIAKCQLIARRYTLNQPHLTDEAFSVAIYELGLAIADYNENKASIHTWILFVIEKRVIDFLRRENRKEESIVDYSLVDEHVPEKGDPVGWEIESEEFVRAISKKIPHVYGKIIVHKYLHAESELEQGRKISSVRSKAMRMLRKKVESISV